MACDKGGVMMTWLLETKLDPGGTAELKRPVGSPTTLPPWPSENSFVGEGCLLIGGVFDGPAIREVTELTDL